MTRSTLSKEFGTHRVTPKEIFPELEWESMGPLGKELVETFEDLTISETWVAIHDNGNFAARHDSIRGDWKEDPTCKIVLAAGISDCLLRVSGFCWLGFFTQEEWASQINSAATHLEESRKKDPKAVAEGQMPERDPIIGVNVITGLTRKRSNNGFSLEWGNERFHPLLRQVRDRLVAAGFEQV